MDHPLDTWADYNRGLAPPVRLAHRVGRAAGGVVRAVRAWGAAPWRRGWALPLLLGGVGFAVLFPFDGAIDQAVRGSALGGDLRRELSALQQYGQFSCIVLVFLIVFLQDRAQRHRLADYLAALGVVGVAVQAMKMFTGRPRPRMTDPYDPTLFLGPLGKYPLDVRIDGAPATILARAWEFWRPISSDLWSMPSSHTAYAVLMSVFLASLYPRLRWVVAGLAGLVGVCRVLFDAHWATDVVVGAAAAYAGARVVIDRSLGVRLAAWWIARRRGAALTATAPIPALAPAVAPSVAPATVPVAAEGTPAPGRAA